VTVAVRFLDADDEDVILDLTIAAGYRVQDVTMPERKWRRSVVASDDVEGDVEVQSVLDSGVYQVNLLVVGDSAWDIEGRRVTLLAAAEQRAYLLEVTTDDLVTVWQARRADSSTSVAVEWDGVTSRPVVLQIPVQPRPAAEQLAES
jgi:hypothetical protein